MSDEITISESEISEAAARIRVVVPPGVPTSMHAIHARETIREALMREKTRAAEIQARRDKDAAIKESHAEINRQNAQRDAALDEARKERDREAELTAVCTAYFNANPGATEDEWRREKTKLIAAFRQQRTLDALKGNESDVAAIPTKFKQSGRYTDF